ncbi:MAG: phospholipase [Ramlibacter sp.]|nr:phospholipase [Ramlibacter sp.]
MLVRLFSWAAALLVAGCAMLPPAEPLAASQSLTDVGHTRLAGIARAGAPDAAAPLSGFRLLPEGPTAFNARIALARNAELSIDAQYYVVDADPVSLLFLGELVAAARRGVRVRLLVDGFHLAGKDELFAMMAREPRLELRVFNPLSAGHGPLGLRLLLSLHEFDRINRRMHNKLLVADNSLAIAGGRNISADYFMHGDMANYVDMDVLASGPIVRELSATFDDYWNSRQVWPIGQLRQLPREEPAATAKRLDDALSRSVKSVEERDVDALGNVPVGRELAAGRLSQVWAASRAYADLPEKITLEGDDAAFEGSVTQATIAILSSARSDLTLISPYFVPGNKGLALIQESAARGVHFLVLTNSLEATDSTLVHRAYARYREAMLRAGVEIYELGARLAARDGRIGDFGSSFARLHAKVSVIDHDRLVMGSMNLDGRSARLNTELGLLIESHELAAQFESLAPIRAMSAYAVRLNEQSGSIEWVEHSRDGSAKVLPEEPGTNWGLRLKDWLLRPFVPEAAL